MYNADYYSLSTVSQYLTPYRHLMLYSTLCLTTLYRLLVSVSLRPLLTSTEAPLLVSTSQILPYVGSVSLCPLLHSRVCPLSVITSHCTVCWFCITMSTAVFYNLSTVCQYFTLNRLLVLCYCVHCCLQQSVHCLSVPHNEPSVGSVSLCPLPVSTSHTVPSVVCVSLCPLLSSTICPPSISTSHCTFSCFCVTMPCATF
jgi:hypothetical protein